MAIPVFSIHGNHDDPSGVSILYPRSSSDTYIVQEGHLAALDILQMSGLINYYGRTPESDNILIKPVLLQKGKTKLALYGMSNVRDERLFRTFRDGNVKFFQPGTQKGDWFNLMSVHQNHHAYTNTGYLPEHFLPDFLDLVVWGHEHECLIDPRTNPETNFRVMQPGSSVATSLVEGEAEPKHVAIVSIRGKDFDVETIRLKTVRPFIFKEIVLSDDKRMRDIAHDRENKSKVHAYLTEVVEGLIEQAKDDWLELQRESGGELDEDIVPPLPLIRLRVEYTAPEGGNYEIENAQRFSNRFVDKVANTADVVQFHRKKRAPNKSTSKPDMPDINDLKLDSVKVSQLVEEFLTAQTLSILPQNQFSESVGLFVDKDDRLAMEDFVKHSMEGQVRELLTMAGDNVDEVDIDDLMDQIKTAREAAFAKGQLKMGRRKGSRKPKPNGWDSDTYGSWEDNPASIMREDDDEMEVEDGDEDATPAPKATAARGKGRGAKAATGTTRRTAAATKKAPAKTNGRSRKKQISDDEGDEEEDVVMLDDDDDDDDEEGLFVTQTQTKKTPAAKSIASSRSTTKAPAKSSARGGNTAAASSSARQTPLSFGASQANGTGSRTGTGRTAAPKRLQEPSEDEISDDDAFEPPPSAATRSTRTGRR